MFQTIEICKERVKNSHSCRIQFEAINKVRPKVTKKVIERVMKMLFHTAFQRQLIKAEELAILFNNYFLSLSAKPMGNDNVGCYSTVQKLGKGRFGKTRLCKTTDDYPIAIKIYEIRGQYIQGTIAQFNKFYKQEIKNMVKIKDTIVIDLNKFGVLMEYYSGGSLVKQIEARPLMQTVKLMKQIAKTVQILHQQHKIPHKNIKPQNLFLVEDEIYFSDLTAPCFQTFRLRQTVGSLDYQAKQTYEGVNSLESDIWSLGIIFIQLITGNRIRSLEALGENIRASLNKEQYPSQQTLKLIQDVDLNYLVKKMVDSEPLERINIRKVINLLDDILNGVEKSTPIKPKDINQQIIHSSIFAPKNGQKQFQFVFDPYHPCLSHFQQAGTRIRRVDKQPKRYQAVSRQSIPAGKWFVNIKILNYGEQNDEVVMGILSEERRKQKMSGDIDQDNSISLWTSLANQQSNLCQNGVWNNTPLSMIRQRVGKLKIIINTDEKQIIWFIDGVMVALSTMPQSYWNQQLFVFVALKGLNCQLQFGEKDMSFS